MRVDVRADDRVNGLRQAHSPRAVPAERLRLIPEEGEFILRSQDLIDLERRNVGGSMAEKRLLIVVHEQGSIRCGRNQGLNFPGDRIKTLVET